MTLLEYEIGDILLVSLRSTNYFRTVNTCSFLVIEAVSFRECSVDFTSQDYCFIIRRIY